MSLQLNRSWVGMVLACIVLMDESLIVADGDTRKIIQDEKYLNEDGVEKP